MNKLPAVLKIVGGIMFVIGFLVGYTMYSLVGMACYEPADQGRCLIRETWWVPPLVFSYFVAGWGVLRRNIMAWLFIIPLVAMLYWSFLQLSGGIIWEYVLLASAPFLIHLGLFFVIVAYRDLYGFKRF